MTLGGWPPLDHRRDNLGLLLLLLLLLLHYAASSRGEDGRGHTGRGLVESLDAGRWRWWLELVRRHLGLGRGRLGRWRRWLLLDRRGRIWRRVEAAVVGTRITATSAIVVVDVVV